jgi:hypothetical protein
MSLMVSLVGGDSSTNTVVVPEIGAHQFQNIGEYPTVYSGVRFGSDGNVYRRQTYGVWSRVATWLHKGTASSFHLLRTTADSLTEDAGSSWLQMDSNRDFDAQHTLAAGYSEADVTFEISNDGGTTTVAGPRVYSFHAEVEQGDLA